MAEALDLRNMSRREFLKLSSASILSLLAIHSTTYAYAQTRSLQDTAAQLGRITTNKVDMFPTPSAEGKPLKTLWKDLVLPITRMEVSSSEPSHNRVWYQLDGQGYVHSGSVQPVKISLNETRQDIGCITLPRIGSPAFCKTPEGMTGTRCRKTFTGSNIMSTPPTCVLSRRLRWNPYLLR